MKFLSNLHTHTTFSDGEHSPEEYVKAAIEKGFVSLGFADHGPTGLDSDSIEDENLPAYIGEIARLREQYAGQIEIYTGLEIEYYAPVNAEGLQYVIGAVHYVRDPETRLCSLVDANPGAFAKGVEQCGGAQAFVLTYYDMVARCAEELRPHILGHLDLITKFNRDRRFFDTREDWYRQAVAGAVERIAAAGCIVEMNTGAMSRGYADIPYPEPFILSLLRERQVPVTISSDCHSVPFLDHAFDRCVELLREAGYTHVMQMRGGKFVPVDL